MRVMVLEDDSEDENEVRVLNDEDVETGAEELQLNVLTFENVLTFDKQTEYYQNMLQCIRLQGKVGALPVLMLVDSGANKNFMSRRLALALGLQITDTSAKRIRLGDGYAAPTLGECYGVIICVQGVKWEIDVVLFELGGYDLILGMAWLTQIGCTYIDWVEKKMRFEYQGEWIEIRGVRTRECTPLQDYVDDNHFAQMHCDINSGMITPNQQLEMKLVLDKFDHVFKEPQGLPPKRQQEHAIHLLKGQGPVNVRPYRYPHHHKTEIEKQVKELLLSGVIRPSQSAFSSPVILVKKKDDSWRMCVDYRALNKVTIPDKFLIPVIDELLDELHGVQYFSKIDLKSGYHQVRMRQEDIHKTAFRTHEGHYEFLVMPFGLTNAPSTFQALMNKVFKPMLQRYVLVFFDDILVFSMTWQDHILHVNSVLSVLVEQQLVANKKKCSFGQMSVEYLGHVISHEGVSMDP
jgi:hypothetical protein